MSSTAAERRFQSRTMTSVSSGPRNFSSAFSGLRRRRRSGRLTPRLSRAPAADGDSLPPPKETGVPFGETLASVGERDVKLHDQMAVAGLVDGPVRAFTSFDDPKERERGELAFRVALLDVRPHRGALRGVLAERKCVEKAQPPRVGDPLERRRSAFVLFVARALEQGGVAGEEVQVPVFDRHFATAQTRLRQRCRSSASHTTPVSYVFENSRLAGS